MINCDNKINLFEDNQKYQKINLKTLKNHFLSKI